MGYPEMMQDIMKQARIDENVKIIKELHGIDIIDYSTGFYNKRYFYLRLNEEMMKTKLPENRFSLILIDANEKVIGGVNNEIHDESKIIRHLSELISYCVRDIVDMPFHLENGKFALLLSNSDESEAFVIKKRIEKMIKEEMIGGISIKLNIEEYSNREIADDVIKSIGYLE